MFTLTQWTPGDLLCSAACTMMVLFHLEELFFFSKGIICVEGELKSSN